MSETRKKERKQQHKMKKKMSNGKKKAYQKTWEEKDCLQILKNSLNHLGLKNLEKIKKNLQTKKKPAKIQKQATKNHKNWKIPLNLKREKKMTKKQRNQYLEQNDLFWGRKNLTRLNEEKTFNRNLELVQRKDNENGLH
jgi:TPP-dependent pyruvate/acetoin dehydrogenase alpha subunit